jgi:hypothetical protein
MRKPMHFRIDTKYNRGKKPPQLLRQSRSKPRGRSYVVGCVGAGRGSGYGRLLASQYLREGLRELMGFLKDDQQAIYSDQVAKGLEICSAAAIPEN